MIPVPKKKRLQREMTSKSSDNPSTHPIQVSESSLGVADIDPGTEEEEIAARMTGVAPHGQRQDDRTYITNNDGIPYPDSAHSKNVGGVLVASDQFLLEKLQRFNRSKTQGRKKLLYSLYRFFSLSPNLQNGVGVAHSAGSGASGYFECTKDMSKLTKVWRIFKPSFIKPYLMIIGRPVQRGREKDPDIYAFFNRFSWQRVSGPRA